MTDNNEAEAKATPQEDIPTTSINELQLNDLRRQAEEYKDKYFRLLAESENARKRLQKEKNDHTQYALSGVISDFLEPIDQFEMALKHTEKMSDEVKHWGIGFKMILSQFKDVLSNNGVFHFESQGKTFDPHYHEAIEVIHTDDHPAGTIVEETRRGYKMGDRTIRPARVKVAKAIPEPAESEEPQEMNEI
jgi:molecular chaperone GrpE